MSSVAPGPSALLGRLRTYRKQVAAFEPERYESSDCAAIAEELSKLEKACSVAAVRAAKRAASCGEHRARGHADEHDWLSKLSGTTSAAARDALRTIESLDECPETRDALLDGDVSLSQASEIVRTEREVPGSEHELLETARNQSLGPVREQARKRRLEAIEPEQRRARQHAAREVKHWTDDLGMLAGTFRLEPVAGARFVKRLERCTDRHWRAAQRDDRHYTRAALAADAFVELFSADRDREASEAASDDASPKVTKPRRRKPSTN